MRSHLFIRFFCLLTVTEMFNPPLHVKHYVLYTTLNAVFFPV